MSQYYYASARVKALENGLMNATLVNRMLEAADAAEAYKYLNDTAYRAFLNEVQDPRDFEILLQKGMEEVYEMLDASTKKPGITRTMKLRNDYTNLKVLLKSEILGQVREDLLSSFGSEELSNLRQAVAGEHTNVPALMQQAILDARAAYEESHDPQVIDLIMEKALYADLLDTVKKLREPFYMEYLVKEIDFLNVKTFLRMRRLEGSVRQFQKAFIPGGILTEEQLSRLYSDTNLAVSEQLYYTPYGTFLTDAFKRYDENGSITEFEKTLDDILFQQVKKAKNEPYGFPVLFGYMKAKENEMKTIRIIMVGKLNRIDPNMIKGRLRELYV